MSRPFAVFDIDGTLIRWQLYHAIANGLLKQGLFDESSINKIKSSRMDWKRRTDSNSFSKYEHLLIDAYDKQLLKLSTGQFDATVNAVFEEYKDQTYIFTRNLIGELKDQNYLLFAISGSQEEIVEKIAKYHHFDDFIGVSYGRDGDKFTGSKDLKALDKEKALKQLVAKHDVSWQGSIAVGDTIGDIPMLELVEQPITFNPEQKLFLHAKEQAWKIVIERKNVVYVMKEVDGQYLLA